jgi:hypothetical protein
MPNPLLKMISKNAYKKTIKSEYFFFEGKKFFFHMETGKKVILRVIHFCEIGHTL